MGGEGGKKDALMSPLRLMYVNKSIQGGVACVRGNVFYMLLVHVALGTQTMNEPHLQEYIKKAGL